MTVHLLNPEALPTPDVYAQMSISEGSRIAFIAGQVARDASGRAVGGGDLAAQTEQVYRNLHAAISAAGGAFSNIAKLTIYIVDYEPSKMEALGEGAVRAAQELELDLVKPITLVGVSALGEPDLLIEIEAVAVLP